MTTELAESSLSTDIHVITAEINAYKRVAGEAIFEIGRRLKDVRDGPVKFGFTGYRDWERWCEEELGMSRRQSNKYIRAFERFAGEVISGKSTSRYSLDALNLLAEFTEDDYELPHTIPSSGVTKTVDEMSVRELREVKAELKRERERAEKAERDYEVIRDTLEAITEQPDEPPRIEYVRDEAEADRLRRYEERFGDISTYESSAYRIPNATDVSASIQTFTYEVRTLLKKYAYLTQYARELTIIPEAVREEYGSTVDALQRFTGELGVGIGKTGCMVINI